MKISIDDKINIRNLYVNTRLSYDEIYKITKKYSRSLIRSYLKQTKLTKSTEIKLKIKQIALKSTLESLNKRNNSIDSYLYGIKDQVLNLFNRGYSINEIKEVLKIKFSKYRIVNLVKSALGISQYYKQANLNKRVKLKTKCKQIGSLVAIEHKGNVLYLKSFPEFTYFLYRYICCFNEFDDIKYEVEFNTPNGIRKSDFLINNINYEIHPKAGRSEKVEFFNYLDNLGIKSVYITTEDCNEYYFRLLRILGIDMCSLYQQIRSETRKGRYFIYKL